MPDFTTTTVNDTATFAVVAMSNLRDYFDYAAYASCGIPEVTLLGEVSDWENIRTRLNSLSKYDTVEGHLSDWLPRLLDIADNFVISAKGTPDVDWWSKINYQSPYGSGTPYITGWITALCAFSDIGVYRDGTMRIYWEDLPVTFAEVDVTIVDVAGKKRDTKFIAGFGRNSSLATGSDTIICNIGWNIYE